MKRFIQLCLWGSGLLAIAIIVINLGIYGVTVTYIYDDPMRAPKAQAILVPGAAIYEDGSLSPIFTDRVAMAITLYKAGKASRILVSGDNSTDTYNEVNPARLYLIENGVLDAAIYLDHAGFDTYSTMYRARDIFGVTSVVIATQAFHLPRAVFLARSLGIEAYGVPADSGTVRFRNTVREVFANEKAVLDLFMKRTPKFLGEKIPIE